MQVLHIREGYMQTPLQPMSCPQEQNKTKYANSPARDIRQSLAVDGNVAFFYLDLVFFFCVFSFLDRRHILCCEVTCLYPLFFVYSSLFPFGPGSLLKRKKESKKERKQERKKYNNHTKMLTPRKIFNMTHMLPNDAANSPNVIAC